MLPKPLRIRALDSCYAAENKCGSVSLHGKKKAGTAELLFTVLKEPHSFNMTHLRVDSSECFLEVYLSYRQAMARLCRSQPVKVVVQKDRRFAPLWRSALWRTIPRWPYQNSCPSNVCVTVTNLFYVVAMEPT